jgi:hypothetical protein
MDSSRSIGGSIEWLDAALAAKALNRTCRNSFRE